VGCERRLVLIEWVDSHGGTDGWKELADCTPDLLVCRSVGWLLHETEQVKVIVPHLIDPDPTTSIAAQGRGDLAIPCAAILSMRELSALAAAPSSGGL
jgi:hypothetical protein